MGTIIEFPLETAARRRVEEPATKKRRATVVILPVVRIERHAEVTNDGGPEQGDAPGRRRRRRVRS